MKLFRTPSPSLAIGTTALFLAIGGGGYAAAAVNWNPTQQHVKQLISHSTAGDSRHLGGLPPQAYQLAGHVVSSHGERFLGVGQTVTLGKAGHFKFTASCSNPSGVQGAQQVTFDVTADTVAGLDGNPPQPAGNKVNIHTNSDKLDSTPDNMLSAGQFDQVGSASSSTEIAADGQEVDVFYNDGVNWSGVGGSQSHDCFAGYTGLLG
jgi:hypothetical protein